MLSNFEPVILVFFMFLFILFLVGSYLLYKVSRAFSLEKKLDDYTIDPVVEHGASFGDTLYSLIIDIEKRLSKWLWKFSICRNYCQKYEIYLNNKDSSTNVMDFVAIKVIWMFFFMFLYSILLMTGTTIFSWLWFLVFILLGFLLPDFYFEYLKRRRIKIIEEDLLKAITIMSNSFKAGKSINQSLQVVSSEVGGPLGEEFDKMYLDLKYGLDLDMVLERFYLRVPVEEVRYMTTSLMILNKTGGNISDIFESIESNFFSRRKLRRELQSTTAAAGAIFKILVVMPFFITLVITFLNPTYFKVLFTTSLGLLLLLVILALYVMYIVAIRYIMKIDY